MHPGNSLRFLAILAVAAVALGAVRPSSAFPTFTVGLDPACDFSTITAAYQAIPADEGLAEIRVAKTYEGQGPSRVRIEDLGDRPGGFSVTFAGGFETCADVEWPVGSRTILTGGANGGFPLVTIAGGAEPVFSAQVIFERFELSDHDLSAHGRDGAGFHISAGNAVLQDIRMTGLTARNGGAIFISSEDVAGGAPRMYLYGDLEMSDNLSTSDAPGSSGGGALRCLGTEQKPVRIHLSGVGLFRRNRAVNPHPSGTAFGGFARLSGCELDMQGRFELSGSSAESGGLISAAGEFGSEVELLALPPKSPLRLDAPEFVLRDSQAHSGGAIFVNGPSRAMLYGVALVGNTAEIGGAIAAFGESEVRVGVDSDHLPFVNTFADNTATELGGALALNNGAGLAVERTVFTGNDAPNGAVAHLGTSAARARIEGSLVFDNDDLASSQELFHVLGPELFLDHVTTAGNAVAQILNLGAGSTAQLRRSLFADEPAVRLVSGAGVVGVGPCVLSSALASDLPELDPLIRLGSVDEAGLMNPAGLDFHLSPGSPAMDRCAGGEATPLDLDGEVRTVDTPGGVPGRRLDAGADEAQDRIHLCANPGTLLDQAVHTFTLPAFGREILDLDLRLELSNVQAATTRYRVEVVSSEAPTSFELIGAVAGRITWTFDEEAWFEQPFRSRPFDFLPTRGFAETTLVLTRISDGPPSVLERWCLSGNPNLPLEPVIFIDGFESGGPWAWTVVSP